MKSEEVSVPGGELLGRRVTVKRCDPEEREWKASGARAGVNVRGHGQRSSIKDVLQRASHRNVSQTGALDTVSPVVPLTISK